MSDDLVLSSDDVAGIVDLFGALTRDELDQALSELAFKRGADPPADAVAEAREAFAVVAYEPAKASTALFVVGPTAFPTLPEGAEDLPHILDVDAREVDREAAARAVEERFRAETAEAVAADDRERIAELLDASYDVEAWGPVDLSGVRDRLDDALADP